MPSRPPTPTLERFVWDEYWPVVGASYSPMWRVRTQLLLREIVAVLGSRPVDQITPQGIETWRHELRLSRGSANVRLNLLRAVLRRAGEAGHATDRAMSARRPRGRPPTAPRGR
jgi:hypothetical protein